MLPLKSASSHLSVSLKICGSWINVRYIFVLGWVLITSSSSSVKCIPWFKSTWTQRLIIFWFPAVPFRHEERMGFSYLVSQKYTGDVAQIEVLRDSETLKFEIELGNGTHRRLIPAHSFGKPPSYYIVAGFVFTTVSLPYLRSEVSLQWHYHLKKCNHFYFKSVQVLILSVMLKDKGYRFPVKQWWALECNRTHRLPW